MSDIRSIDIEPADNGFTVSISPKTPPNGPYKNPVKSVFRTAQETARHVAKALGRGRSKTTGKRR